MFLLYTAIAAAIFAVCVTRPGMRLLTEIWPKFFDQMDWIFTTGLEDGLYGYSCEFGASDEEEQVLENSLLIPLIKINAAIALAISWFAGLLGASTLGAICLGFLGSLLSLLVGLAIIGLGRIMIGRRQAHPLPTVPDSCELAQPLPYGIADRAYDFFADSNERLKKFEMDPRPLANFFDRIYDAVRARLPGRNRNSF
jgi:hypothetical protein